MKVNGFVNYYRILEINPNSSLEAIEHRFRSLARLYHPDNQETGDRSKFDAIVQAHNILKDTAKRARYHEDNHEYLPPLGSSPADDCTEDNNGDIFEQATDGVFIDSIGIDRDTSIQNNLLTMLYMRRRQSVNTPGIGNAELERLSGCPPEHLDFHLWYLKAKGWISAGEDGLLAITVSGVDRASVLYQEHAKKLITDQS